MQDNSDTVRQFREKLRRSNLGLVIAAVLIVGLGVRALVSDRASDRISGAFIIVIALFILYQTYKRWMPAQLAYRAQLERRRDDLRSIWWWYVCPFFAALLLFAFRLPFAGPDFSDVWVRILPFVLLSAVWSATMVRLSERDAQALQREIEMLNQSQDGERK